MRCEETPRLHQIRHARRPHHHLPPVLSLWCSLQTCGPLVQQLSSVFQQFCRVLNRHQTAVCSRSRHDSKTNGIGRSVQNGRPRLRQLHRNGRGQACTNTALCTNEESGAVAAWGSVCPRDHHGPALSVILECCAELVGLGKRQRSHPTAITMTLM